MQGNQHFILTSKRFNDLDPIVSLKSTTQKLSFTISSCRHVNMKALVVYLCNSLFSKHLLLRRECIACLRQLAQRHPHELAGIIICLVMVNIKV